MSTGSGIAALILAAGYSSRLGAFKPLSPVGQSTIIEEAVQRLRAAGIDDIRVVTGHRAEELAPVLARLQVREVVNPDYDQGMLSSVRAGVRSLEPEIAGLFLLPVDIPLVKPRTITALLQAFRRGGRIIYPCFQGLRGHPPLISVNCFNDLPTSCEGGLGGFLSRHDDEALDLEVVDEAILLDCDTPEDYRRLLSYGRREDLPSRRECEALWNRQGLPEPARAHCRLVAALAGMLARHLNCAGIEIDTRLVVAAGYLHDLAKGQPDHARVGGRLLEELGYGRVGRVVASHTDIEVTGGSIDESALLYLADKFASGDRLVTLRERFRRAFKRFVDKPEILAFVAKRLEHARIIKHRLEEVLGLSLEELIRRYDRSLWLTGTGEPRKIYLARHGAIRPQGNSRCFLGQLDIPLSTEGICQVEALRERLRQIPLAAVYCSDLRRSVQTAEIIAGAHGLRPNQSREFREIGLGAWEGLTFDEVRQRYPEEYAARGRDFSHFRPPGGESFLDLAHRVLPALQLALSSTGGDILLVGHAGVNRILLCQAQGRSLAALFDVPQDYGCLNLLRYQDFELELEVLNDICYS